MMKNMLHYRDKNYKITIPGKKEVKQQILSEVKNNASPKLKGKTQKSGKDLL